MEEEIIGNFDNPKHLERLYRENKSAFKVAFNNIYPEFKDNQIAQVWYERLNFENEEILWGNKKDLFFTVVASVVAGFLAKIPAFTAIEEEFFYPRNISFIVLPLMIAFFFSLPVRTYHHSYHQNRHRDIEEVPHPCNAGCLHPCIGVCRHPCFAEFRVPAAEAHRLLPRTHVRF